MIPDLPHTKKPYSDGWQHLRITTEAQVREAFRPGDNIGGLAGGPSGNKLDVDLDSIEALHVADAFLPPTGMVFGRASKPRSHHIYTAVGSLPKTMRLKDPVASRQGDKDAMLLELRSTGCQTVLPGSLHADTGEEIAYSPGGDGTPAGVDSADLRACVYKVGAAALLARYWATHARHQLTLPLAGALLRRGWAQDEVVTFIEVVAQAAGDDQIEDRIRAVVDTAATLDAGEPTTGIPTLESLLGTDIVKALIHWLGLAHPTASAEGETTFGGYTLNDDGNALRFADQYKGEYLFAADLDRWYRWDHVIWAECHREEMVEAARVVARRLMEEVEAFAPKTATQEQLAKAARKWARDSGNGTHIRQMLTLARADLDIAITPDALNANPRLMTFPGGNGIEACTLDLDTDEAYPPRPEDHITQQAGAPYEPTASHPLVTWLLDKTLPDAASRDDVFTYFGYCLTGSPKEHVGIFLGGTKTGKSTIASGIGNALGDYAAVIDISTFTAGTSTHTDAGRSREDLVSLVGKRLVVASEVNPNARLNAAQLKTLTSGGDKQSIRANYGKQFATLPTYGIVMLVNDLPKLPADDDAVWERLHVFSFTRYIPPEERDEVLRDATVSAAVTGSAWLACCLAGWRRFRDEHKRRLVLPTTVAATAEYRSAEDVVQHFIADCCTLDPSSVALFADFKRTFHEWAKDNDIREQYTDTRLGRILGRRFEVVAGATRAYRGIKLAPMMKVG